MIMAARKQLNSTRTDSRHIVLADGACFRYLYLVFGFVFARDGSGATDALMATDGATWVRFAARLASGEHLEHR
jgi:hypothetical protein